jgi:hypothetical protein
VSNWRYASGQNLKRTHGFSQEYARNLDSVNLSAFKFNLNTKFDLISTFLGELPKSQMWRKEEI